MFTQPRFRTYLFLTGKKLIRSKSICFLYLLLLGTIIYVLLVDSLSTALKYFFFIIPYFFLFITADMVRNEVESGGLENVLFLNSQFRLYLCQKNFILFLLAFLLSTSFFMILAVAALIQRNFVPIFFINFLAGLVVGLYYLSLGSWLSFYFRCGANVMVMIMAQVVAVISLFISMQNRNGFVYYLEKGHFPDLISGLKFGLLALVVPGLLTYKSFLNYLPLPVLVSFLFLQLQRQKLKKLELKKQ